MILRCLGCAFLLILLSSGYCAEKKPHDHSSFEKVNLVRLSEEVIKRYRIKIAKSGPQRLTVTKQILGKIAPDANKTIYIYPRYSGIIKKMTKFLGDKVQKGALLAQVESNQSLQTYDVTAPFGGYIVRKNANPGEFVKTGNPIYQVADLSSVWVLLYVYRENAAFIKKGQTVFIYDKNHPDKSTSGQIDYVSPLGIEHNQTMMARMVLYNKPGQLTWIPGLYVNATVVIKNKNAAVAVTNNAIQTIENNKVIFVKTNEGFEARVCEFGLAGQHYTEVKKGLNAGEAYVAENSFILKADLEKSSAAHRH